MSGRLVKRQYTVKTPRPALRTAAGDAFTDLVGQVVRLVRLFTVAGDALARPAGQTLARWLVLETVDERPATVAQIARTLHLARQSVQRVADLLEHERLARYEENPAHRRARLLQLTPRGRAVLRTIQQAQGVWADALGAEIGEADLKKASVVLDRVLRVVTAAKSDL